MGILNNSNAIPVSGAYELEDSLRFRSSASAYLSRTPSSDGNKRTWTFSCWTKRGTLTGSQVIFSAANSANSQFVDVTINGNNVFELDILDSNSTRTIRTSTAVLRDPSAWYHIVLVIDTTQATDTNRIKLYVNNELLTTSAGTGTFPNQNADTQVNATTGIHAIARRQGSADRYYDAYLTEIQHIDGTALTPSDFGETDDNGTWIPKRYTGTYGTNGFYLPFKNNSSATFVNTFNGSSQSLSVVGSADMALGTGDCTVECYFKVDSLVDYRSIIDNRPSSASSAGFSIDINANGSIYNYSDGFIVQSANGVISAGQYYHVAYTRASGTHRLFVDGVQVATATTSRDYTNDDIFIGRAPYGGEWFDGEISNVRIVKGTAVYTSNFTPSETNLTAVTNTKLLTCQSATIVDNSGESQTIVNEGTVAASTGNPFRTLSVTSDQSGNINNWVSNNINLDSSSDATYDLMSDVPTLTDEDTSNFATLNPNNAGTNSDVTFGNLKIANASSHSTIYPTNMPTTGKYYFECKMALHAAAGGLGFRTDTNKAESAYAEEANKYFLYLNNSSAYIVSETSNVNIGSNLNSGTATFQVAIDFDASEYYFGVNNTWYAADAGTDGNPATGANPTYNLTDGTKMFPFVHTGGLTWTVNFGQQPFAYTPPTGFKKINAFNLPDSTIEDGKQHFDIQLWTGDNANPRSFSNTAFSPDLVWYKARNNAYSHNLYDTNRGATVTLYSNSVSAEYTNDVSGTLESFDSDGFTVGGDTDVTTVNGTGQTYVGWQWRGSDSTAASNGDGSITSTVSANTTAGFSIATWTMPTDSRTSLTLGHGLSAAPKMIITKSRNGAGNWLVYHADLGPNDYVVLDNTSAKGTNSGFMNNTAPTSSVFTHGSWYSVSGYTMVSYCFAEVEGYSKFGSYTGNGSADGPFVYTGFRPAFVLIKVTSTTDEWVIYDTARDTYNVANKRLNPNSSGAEQTSQTIDIVSNGFKPRSTGANINQNAATYIYMAFAENPFKNSNAR